MNWITTKAKKIAASVIIFFVCVIVMFMFLFVDDSEVDDINNYWRWL